MVGDRPVWGCMLCGVACDGTAADPAPVAQTFFADETVFPNYDLDGIVTVVDSKHLLLHLDDEKPEGVVNEAVEQVAFADRILLNKVDLASEEELKVIETRIRDINKTATITRTQNSIVDLSSILGTRQADAPVCDCGVTVV
jgi:G3E family GTPase